MPSGRPVSPCLLAFFLLLAGCAGVIPQGTREAIDPTLTFVTLRADPEAGRGKRAALGGKILGVTVRSQETETEIEVLQYPLRSDDAPDPSASSEGRFLVRRAGTLDPAAYATGRFLTVVGTVEGSAERRIGEVPYRYPVLQAEFLHLWLPREIAHRRVPSHYPWSWIPRARGR